MQSRNVALSVSAVLVLLAVAGCVSPDHSPTPEPARLLAEVVLEAPLGSGPDDLGALFAEGAEPQVPAAYWITRDSAVVVLDTLKGRFVEYRDATAGRSVPVVGLVEGRAVAVADDGTAFVYDAVASAVFQVDREGAVTRYPLPDDIAAAHVRLREGAGGKIVLALNEDEYDIGPTPGNPSHGLTFDGHDGRHLVESVHGDTVAVRVDGRERWRVAVGVELLGVRLLGYDAAGSLIAEAYRPSAADIVLLAFGPGQTVRLAPVDLVRSGAAPDDPLTVGQDGGLYLMTYEAGRGVLRRLRWSEPDGPG